MDENKSMSIAVLGVVAVIAVVSVVLLLTNSGTTGLNVGVGDKVYGGVARSGDRTYARATESEQLQDGGVPFRTYKRALSNIPSWQTACGPDEETMDFNKARDRETRYDMSCRKINGAPDGRYCCPLVNLARDEVIE